jgi:hypothetical protein
MTLLGFIPYLVGCARTQVAHRKPTSEIPVAATVTATEQAPRRTHQRADSTSKPRHWTWKRSKVRKTLRRGAYATEEGTKEVARLAGVAALYTVAAAAIAALLYWDLTNDDSFDIPTNY